MRIRLGNLQGLQPDGQANQAIGPQAFVREHAATLEALGSCGIDLSRNSVGTDPRKLVEAVGSTFLTELPPVEFMQGISATERKLIADDLQPELKRGIQSDDKSVLALAYQLGRMIGSDARTSARQVRPVDIQPGRIVTEGFVRAV